MELYQTILCVVLNAIWVIPLSHELIIATIDDHKRLKEHSSFIKQQNEEYRKNHPVRKRKKCIDCSYCRWKNYHPFQSQKYYWSFVTKEPYYCRKFKKKLENDPLLTCISELDSKAVYYEDSE